MTVSFFETCIVQGWWQVPTGSVGCKARRSRRKHASGQEALGMMMVGFKKSPSCGAEQKANLLFNYLAPGEEDAQTPRTIPTLFARPSSSRQSSEKKADALNLVNQSKSHLLSGLWWRGILLVLLAFCWSALGTPGFLVACQGCAVAWISRSLLEVSWDNCQKGCGWQLNI